MSQHIPPFRERWNNLPAFWEALLRDLCEQMITVLQNYTPGNTLPMRWTFEVTRAGNDVEAKIWNQVLVDNPDFTPIMGYLNNGTSDHWIEPRNALALSWEEDGVRYFSKGHRVSGIKAANFIERANVVYYKFLGTVQRKYTRYMNTGQLP